MEILTTLFYTLYSVVNVVQNFLVGRGIGHTIAGNTTGFIAELGDFGQWVLDFGTRVAEWFAGLVG